MIFMELNSLFDERRRNKIQDGLRSGRLEFRRRPLVEPPEQLPSGRTVSAEELAYRRDNECNATDAKKSREDGSEPIAPGRLFGKGGMDPEDCRCTDSVSIQGREIENPTFTISVKIPAN